MTAHDLAGTSWAVIDRPYNSDASRLFFSMSAHSKFLEIRRSVLPYCYGAGQQDSCGYSLAKEGKGGEFHSDAARHLLKSRLIPNSLRSGGLTVDPAAPTLERLP